MLNRNRPNLAQTLRIPGVSPSRRPDYPIQKQNFIPNQMPKPLISPKNQHSQRLPIDRPGLSKTQSSRTGRSPPALSCCNHPNKKAEFMTYVEEGQQYFCGRCAAQLATQGCKVQALESSVSGMRVSKKNELPHLPEYEHEPIYQEIVGILKLCNSVVADHNSNLEQFGSLEEEYAQQAQLTGAFYDRLVQIIEEMKADHLADLMQERDKYTQIAQIENENIRENIIEINNIKGDIQGNMEEVLEGIRNSGDPSQCRESLQHYRQKLTLFRHQTEQQLESLGQVTRYSQPMIDSMLLSFQNFLAGMWEQAQSPVPPQNSQIFQNNQTNQTYQTSQVNHSNQINQGNQNNMLRQNRQPLNNALTVKNIHQILPRAVAYENHESKRAFRNLEAEEEEEENLEERRSPNFKKI